MRKGLCEGLCEHHKISLLLSHHPHEKSLTEFQAGTGSRLTGAAAPGGAAGNEFNLPSFWLVSYSQIPRWLCNKNKIQVYNLSSENRLQH